MLHKTACRCKWQAVLRAAAGQDPDPGSTDCIEADDSDRGGLPSGVSNAHYCKLEIAALASLVRNDTR